MTTINATPSSSQYKYLDPRLIDLPTTGQMYGSKSTLNLESILTSGAQIVIDLGDKKDNMAADLDALQRQIGMPVIFIEADLPHMAEAYRTLGNILSGKEARGEELAAFVEETVSMAKENALKIQDAERISVLYTSGSSGLNTNAKGSIQAQVLDLMGIENAAVVEDVSNKGGGNPINLEQLYRFDPDVILFTAGSTYSTAADDEAWQPLRAIEAGRYYEIPSMPYNWLSNPPSLNMLLGVWWLGNLLYPQYYAYDMVEKTQEMFRLLWSLRSERGRGASHARKLYAEGYAMKKLLTRGVLLVLLCAALALPALADSVTDSISVCIGYFGWAEDEFVEKAKFTWQELDDWYGGALDTHEEFYSYSNGNGRTYLVYARGFYIRDLLDYAGVDVNSIASIDFFTKDHSNGAYRSFTKYALLDQPRYYFPNLAADPETGELYAWDGGDDLWVGAYQVEPMLALEDYTEWDTSGFDFESYINESRFSTGNRFHLFSGKPARRRPQPVPRPNMSIKSL